MAYSLERLSIRQEVQHYTRICEHLLSAALFPGNPPFNEDEMKLIEYYAAEIARLVTQPKTASVRRRIASQETKP